MLLLLSGMLCLQVTAQLSPDSTGGKKKKKIDNFFYGTAGFQLSGINGDSESFDQLLPGFYAGIGIRLIELNEVFGIRTELTYSTQGAKYKDTYVSGKVLLNYISLPVLVRATTPSGFYGEAGVQPAVLLSAKDKYDSETYDFKEYVNGFDFSGLVGAGYQKNKVGLGIRVAPGFSNLNKEGDSKDHNFVASIRATFAF